MKPNSTYTNRRQPNSWSTTSATLDYAGGNHRLVAIGSNATATVQRDFATNANEQHSLSYNLALLNGGSATVKVQQQVGASYVDLAGTTQTHTASGTYNFNFTPTEADIRVVVAGTSRYALTQVFMDRNTIEEVIETYTLSAGGYRYGFNGMEKDDEVKGKGNSYTAEFWQYDSRLGRRWNIDPMTGKYPWQSPYSTFNNNPIFYVDPLGLEEEEPTEADRDKGTWQGPSGKTYNYDKDADMWYKPEDEVTITAEKKSMISQLFTDIGRAIGIGYATAGQPKTGGKGSEWLGNMTLGNHFGNGPSIGREGKGRFYTDKNSPHYDSWMRGRANHAALENFMAGYMGGSLAAPFVIAGAITTAPVWSPYLAMGANYTMQAARAYHNTFGKTGGYANMLVDGGLQSLANKDFNYYSFIGSGFLPGNNYRTIATFEMSTASIDLNQNGVSIKTPTVEAIFGLSTSKMWSVWGVSKYGDPTVGLTIDATLKASEGIVREHNNNK